ncbi:MAG: hypothetical protein ACLRNA_10320 [Gemmiger formicilis]|uniref:hypothetical protein n=1 Tax=Gemmiger formicilis TaxID=745368 RepID=UPI003A29B48E
MILVNKAAEPNPAYAVSNRQVVNNWFDGELDETCWSVRTIWPQPWQMPRWGLSEGHYRQGGCRPR